MYSRTFDQDFNKNFLLSLGIHTLLIVVFYLAGNFFSDVFQSKDVEVIKASVRVDVVGMPKFTVQELKDMQARANQIKNIEVAQGVKDPAKSQTEDVIKEGDLVIQEVDKKKKNSFLNIVSDYSNKKVEAKKNKKGEKSGEGDKNLDNLILEGNRISKGSALVGDYSDVENSEFSAYVQNLPEAIRPHWKLPSYLLDKNLRCRIRVYLSASGNILKLDVIEPSGQAEFDDRAVRAVKSASFPKPSAAVFGRLVNSGIILGFPL